MRSGSTAFVSGATGFIGTRLVQMLTEHGCRVRALCRRDAPAMPPGAQKNPLRHPLVELVPGDIRDAFSIRRAMNGCTHVFHLAAYARNWAPDPQTFYEMNVEGMRHVFDAAVECNVERVVWTSTCMTLGPSRPGETIDEATPRHSDRFLTLYEETKTIAEAEALARAEEGFPVVIVNPTRVFGPGHLTEGNSVSRLIDDYRRGRAPFLLNRGRNVGNWAYVDDVARGHLLAMEHGRIGQRYLLGGENASLRQFFELIDELSECRHWKIPMLKYSPLVFAWLQQKRAEWFGVYPTITPGWIETFCTDWAYRCDKAINELNYCVTPLGEAMRTTLEWLATLPEDAR